jgi:Arc/MetJ-type ribon-helix-helix transcriptional regulator
MAATHDLQVKLSEEAFQYVRAKVSSGDSSSASDVVNQGVALLRQKDREFEAWLNEEETPYGEGTGEMAVDPIRARWEQEVVIPAHDELLADPASGLTEAELDASLERARAEWLRGA